MHLQKGFSGLVLKVDHLFKSEIALCAVTYYVTAQNFFILSLCRGHMRPINPQGWTLKGVRGPLCKHL